MLDRENSSCSAATPLELRNADLFTQAKSLQEKLKSLLNSDYRKAFDEHFKPGFFANTNRFKHVKKPLAHRLNAYCEISFTSLIEIAAFIAYYEYAVKLNKEKDPVGYFDFLRGKRVGGDLGYLLGDCGREMVNLKADLQKEISLQKNQLETKAELANIYYALATEIDYGKLITKDFKLLPKDTFLSRQEYYEKKLETLRASFVNKPEKEQEELLQLDGIWSAKLENRETFSAETLTVVHETNISLLQQRLLNRVLAGHFQEINVNDDLKDIIKDELLRQLKHSLLAQEKLYFWCLNVRALRDHSQDKDREDELYKLVNHPINLLAETLQNYNTPGFLPFFSNKELQITLQEEFNDIKDLRLLVREIKKDVEAHVNALPRLKSAIEKKEVWIQLFLPDGYLGVNYHWHAQLNLFLAHNLIFPLIVLDEYLGNKNGKDRLLQCRLTGRLSFFDHEMLKLQKELVEERENANNVNKVKELETKINALNILSKSNITAYQWEELHISKAVNNHINQLLTTTSSTLQTLNQLHGKVNRLTTPLPRPQTPCAKVGFMRR